MADVRQINDRLKVSLWGDRLQAEIQHADSFEALEVMYDDIDIFAGTLMLHQIATKEETDLLIEMVNHDRDN